MHSPPFIVHPELFDICTGWSREVAGLEDPATRLAYFETKLPDLLANQRIFIKCLNNMRKGRPYADLRQATMFPDELLLYMDAARRFSLRMFIYESGAYTPIHDHTAWGVTGSTLGKLEVIQYKRLDQREKEGYAKVAVCEKRMYDPGEIEITPPLDRGIHQTGNPNGGATIMISVYGTPIRRLYINRYDMDNSRVYKMYPPRIRKKWLITRALRELMVDKRKKQFEI